jgi:hypothetical protein
MQIPPSSILSLAGQAAVTSRAPATQSQQATASADKSRQADLQTLSSASQEDVAELTGDGSQVGDRDADGREAWHFSGGQRNTEEEVDPAKDRNPASDGETTVGSLDVVV